MKHFSFHHREMAVTGVLLVFVIGIWSFLAPYLDQFSPISERACTMEAMICPDGSAVGRSGPNCEFTACPPVFTTPGITEVPFEVPKGTPSVPGLVACTQEVKICSDGSFVARTGPKCEFAPCPDDLELDVDR